MSFSIPSVSHDPDEKLDYETNWRADTDPVLELGESIASSAWAIDGMRNGANATATTAIVTSDGACTVLAGGPLDPSISGDVTKCWVQGGTLGKHYLLRNRITTDSSPARIHDRSRWLTIDRH
jgi:hypothetical protein